MGERDERREERTPPSDRPSAGHKQSSQEGEMLRGLTATRATRASGRGTLQVVAATTPQFKSTKHHQRSRPKKTRPSERNKTATKYDPLPTPPPEYEVVSAKAKSSDKKGGGKLSLA